MIEDSFGPAKNCCANLLLAQHACIRLERPPAERAKQLPKSLRSVQLTAIHRPVQKLPALLCASIQMRRFTSSQRDTPPAANFHPRKLSYLKKATVRPNRSVLRPRTTLLH
jgi:hypothetical protein